MLNAVNAKETHSIVLNSHLAELAKLAELAELEELAKLAELAVW